MAEKQQHTGNKKRRRWPWVTLAVILLVVLGIRLSLKSSFVHDIVRSQIEQAANASLNASLEIGDLQGDLWKEISLQQVSLTSPDADTVFRADTLFARYQLLSYFGSAFQVEDVRLTNPFVSLQQQRDGSTNLQNLVKETSADTVSSETSPFHFEVGQLALNGGKVKGVIQSLETDSVVTIRDLTIHAAGSYLEAGYSVQLRELAFKVGDTRLPPIEVQSSARANEREITLENLVVGTGRSLLESSAEISTTDSSASLNVTARPLAWRDIAAYIQPEPIRQDLQLELSLSGQPSDFNVGLKADGEGIAEFDLNTAFEWRRSVVLKKAELNITELDLQALAGDTALPRLKNFQLSANGRIDIADYQRSTLEGTLSASEISQSNYAIDQLEGSFSLSEGELNTELNMSRAVESLNAQLAASQIWSENPRFKTTVRGRNIQPGYWMQDSLYQGQLNFQASLNGAGLELSDDLWDYQLEIDDSQIGEQQLAMVSLQGQVNESRLTAESRVRLQQSELSFTAEVDSFLTEPAYTYEVFVNKLNLAECQGFEELPTAINAHLKGEGRYTTPEQLELSSTIRIDSSIVNNEFIEELSADISVQDTVAEIQNGRLRSAIADGDFESTMHLLRWYDLDNRLDMNFDIKDIQTFASLAGVETLQTSGNVAGQISPVQANQLQFTGSVDLKDLVFGELLSSEAIEGNVEVMLEEQPQYSLELNLSNPIVNSVVLQDVSTTIRGQTTPDSTYGNIELMFSSASGSRLEHAAAFTVADSTYSLRTESLQIISDLRTLSLSQPFSVVVEQQHIRMDTLRLESKDGAAMEMAIPYADSTSQRGYLLGQNLNLKVIQNTLLSESYFEGLLSGRLHIDREDTRLSASGDLQLSELAYNGVSMDSLALAYKIDNDRLEGGLQLYDEGEQLASGDLQVPFKLGDPTTFDPAFFEEQVTGRFTLREHSIKRYQQVMQEAGITNTYGLVLMEGRLSGTAGQPEMTTSFKLRDASISGVAVDSVTAVMDYDHATRQLEMNSSVVSLNQKAAEIRAQVPVYLDLKAFDMTLPQEDDSIRVDITTNQFNLASLNDFVDRTEFREIQGRLDGNVVIDGPLNKLGAEGNLSFEDGAVRIMEVGIKLTGIRSAVNFRNDRVQIERMRANSGTGTFTASGSMNFDELQPGALDIAMEANNFRVANTADYSAIINMNTKLNGTMAKPTIKGKLSFVSGFLYLQNFGEKSVEAVQLDSAGVSDQTSYMQYDSLSMEMDVSFDRRFYVRNRQYLDLEYELDGQVDLVKEPGQDLQMFGALGASSGYARPLGKRFDLEEGIITFRGDPTNPELNIRHIFIPPQQDLGDIRIWYIIEGNVEDPQFKYESEPPMGLEDIISYTLFGKPFLSLDPWKQVVANSGSNTSAADMAMDVLLDKVEALATQRLGIDVVQIDNTRNGADSSTSIKTGWYLNPKVFFAIQNEITGSTPDTIFILEYLLKKNLKLIITQGSNSQTGLDVRWQHDY